MSKKLNRRGMFFLELRAGKRRFFISRVYRNIGAARAAAVEFNHYFGQKHLAMRVLESLQSRNVEVKP